MTSRPQDDRVYDHAGHSGTGSPRRDYRQRKGGALTETTTTAAGNGACGSRTKWRAQEQWGRA